MFSLRVILTKKLHMTDCLLFHWLENGWEVMLSKKVDSLMNLKFNSLNVF
jgi:hypothetical protein